MHYCPGNHEDYGTLEDGDFFQYRSRFNYMPGGAEVRKAQSIFHSFNVGLVHVVMFSSEALFSVGAYSLLLLPEMFAWVEADLKAVNRTATPWIITSAHQPMYCSPNDDGDDCHSLVSLSAAAATQAARSGARAQRPAQRRRVLTPPTRPRLLPGS